MKRLAREMCWFLVLCVAISGCSDKSTDGGGNGGNNTSYLASASGGDQYLAEVSLTPSEFQPPVLSDARGTVRFAISGDTVHYVVYLTNITGVTLVDVRGQFPDLSCNPNGYPFETLYQSAGSGAIAGILIDSTQVFSHEFLHPEVPLLLNTFPTSCVQVRTQANSNGELAGNMYESSTSRSRVDLALQYNSNSGSIAYTVNAHWAVGIKGIEIRAGGLTQTGPVVATLFEGAAIGEVWKDTVLADDVLSESDIQGGYTLSRLLGIMDSGLTYLQVNTARKPSGAIRAQIRRSQP